MEGSAAKSDRGMQFEVHVIPSPFGGISSRNARGECNLDRKLDNL